MDRWFAPCRLDHTGHKHFRIATTVDHVETVYSLYLMQCSFHLTKNIHQYVSVRAHKIYLVNFVSSDESEAPEAKISKSLPVLAQNLTRLILHSSEALGG